MSRVRLTSCAVFALPLIVAGSAAGQAPAPVADAALRGDLSSVRALLAEGADPNEAQGDGMTALHWAAERSDEGMAALLLEAGASAEATTRLGAYTPLHLAARAGHEALVRLLLEAGADVHATTGTGGAHPLHMAAAAGAPGAVGALLAHGADPEARESAWGQTPLMFAAAAGRTEAVRALLGAGADPAVHAWVLDVPSRLRADAEDRRDRAERLRAGVDPRPASAGRPPESLPRPALASDRTAAGGSDPRASALGYSDGDRPPEEPEPLSYADLVGGHGGLTALLHAVREGHAATALALLDGGADIDQGSAGDGTSPLLMALLNGHFDLGLELLARGADATLASHAGATPLYVAINTHWAPKARYPQQHAHQQQRASYLDVARALLEAGADPNARLTKHLWYMSYNFDLLQVDTRGATPFWRAAYSLDVGAMRLLVVYGADPGVPTEKAPERRRRGGDGPDPSGLPPVPVGGPAHAPIHAATGIGYGEGYAGNAHRHVPDGWLPAVRYLVEELGADPNARDLNGYSPLHNAAARGDNELIEYLVERGADPTVVSRRGQTTADMANGPYQRTQPYPETVALLERLGSKNNHNCVSCQ